MPSKTTSISNPLMKNTSNFLMFSISLICLLSFFYMNIYSLPLGGIDVSSSLEHADNLEGIEISIYGDLFNTGASEFILLDGSTDAILEGIWLSDTALPSDGTYVIASGQMIMGPSNPVLMCESVHPQTEEPVIYQNPWTLPIIRILVILFLWFILMASVTGILALHYLLRHNVVIRNRMRAMTEIGILSGVIMISLLVFLLITENEVIAPLSISSYVAIFSLLLLVISAQMRSRQQMEIVELADSVPIIAWIAILISIPLNILLLETLYSDFVAEAIIEQLSSAPISLLIGLAGFILMGLYFGQRKFRLIGLRIMQEYIGKEVKKY